LSLREAMDTPRRLFDEYVKRSYEDWPKGRVLRDVRLPVAGIAK